MNTKKIGFIGGGNMATYLLKGLIASGHPSQQLWVADPNAKALETISSQLMDVHCCTDNLAVANAVDVVVFAVKPDVLKQVALDMADIITAKQVLVVSIAAGISQASLSKWLGENTAIVRCMPNTPSAVLTGASGMYANLNVTEQQRDLAENILRSVGIALWLDQEQDIDAVTAVSGSGPAYYFLLMEAMEKAALELGLTEITARLLIQQTALGAAKIALESTDSPQRLRQHVTSPNGTTQKAIETFQAGGFEALVIKALHAARNRSIDLSQEEV
jgi:pyrroline-5-carboxylate reductase